ncbi:MAG: NADAR family protein [Thermosynechococcaceae cyanobacterium]
MTIFFYKVCDPYGCFSNFSPHSIVLGGYLWPTAEHYYQAQKFVGTRLEGLMHTIRIAPSPEMAAAIGRDPKYGLRSDWDQVKTAVMYEVVSTKFRTYADLRTLLLNTGTEWIVEKSPTDAFWGCGADGKGQNQLGQILMRIRAELERNGATLTGDRQCK